MPKISICIPAHREMKHYNYFMERLLDSIYAQSFRDFEIIVTHEGKMAENTNAAMAHARGELIKVLYMDDYFAHPDALQEIVDAFKPEDHWLVTGCLHQMYEPEFYEDPHSPHYPTYNEKIYTGVNTIGSPSVLTMRNEGHLTFDSNLSWLLDCDLYYRLHSQYGSPRILNDLNIVIGIHTGQTSVLMSEGSKLAEYEYVMQKYA